MIAPLHLEGARSHTNPGIKVTETIVNLGYPHVVGPSSNDRIQVMEDGLDVSPLLTPRQPSDLVLEPFEGFISDSQSVIGKSKPDKLETLSKVRDPSFGLVQRELEFVEYLPYQIESLSSFLAVAADNDEVICVSHMTPTSSFDGLIQVIEHEITEPG